MSELASRTSTIAGVLWHQGESECGDERYLQYEEKFTVILNEFRRRLDLNDVPFLLGGLGDFLKDCDKGDFYKNYVYVNKTLKKISENEKMVGFVPADGLSGNPDNMHFSAKGLREFGVRYFNEFLKLENKDKVFREKSSCDYAIRTDIEDL